MVTPVDSHGYLPVDFSHILLHLIEVGSGDSGTPGPPFEAFAVEMLEHLVDYRSVGALVEPVVNVVFPPVAHHFLKIECHGASGI